MPRYVSRLVAMDPKTFCRVGLHRSFPLGHREAVEARAGSRRKAGEKRLGANSPQAFERSESAAPVAAAGEEPDDEQEDRGADEGHDHRADDRMPGHGDVEMEEACEHDSAEQGSHYADDDVPEQTQAMAESNVARQEA